jgi:hypothetical protein
MQVFIRTYQASDRNELIAIFHSNCPKYFDPADLNDLLYYLDHYADENFKVVLLNGKLVGCGGHYVKQQEKVFGIAWVMFKRHALGAIRFKHIAAIFFADILTAIQKEPYRFDILINTTQLMERIFNSYGFETEQVIQDGFGQNLDHLVMRRLFRLHPPGS